MACSYAEITVSIRAGIWELSGVTDAFLQLTGYSLREIGQLFHNDFWELPIENAGSVHAEARRQLAEDNCVCVEFSLRRVGKSPIRIALRAEAAEPFRVSLTDITEYFERYHRLNARFQTLEACTPGGVCQFRCDGEGTVLWHNDRFLDILGYTRKQFEEELQCRAAGYVISEDWDRVKQLLAGSFRQGRGALSAEIHVKRRDGEIRSLSATFAFLPGEPGETPSLYSVGIDTTEYNRKCKELEYAAELEKWAEKDPLTNLYNRAAAELRIDRFLEENPDSERICALYMLDLDNFKHVNDLYGHVQGDAVLEQAANAIVDVFDQNNLVGRIGGDEFVIFAPDCESREAAMEKGRRLCDSLCAALREPCPLSASVGVAFAPQDGQGFASLYHCADTALYRAKREGKNCCTAYSRAWGEPQADTARVPVSRDWLLDESNDLVYVSDLASYEILYMNNHMMRLFNVPAAEDYKGKKCFAVMQGKDSPCSFCTNHLLSRDRFYTWEFRNQSIDRYFLIRDRIVDWYGIPARIELATDITERENQNCALEKQTRSNQFTIECLRTLCAAESPNSDLYRTLLEQIGVFYEADRVYIKEHERGDGLFCEWTREGIATRPAGEGLITAPLLADGTPVGEIGLVNPRQFCPECSVLDTLGYFIAAQLEKWRKSL